MTDHYLQQASIEENKTDGTFEVVFENKDTHSQVKLSIPFNGAFRDPNKRIDRTKVEALAQEISVLLCEHLEEKHD